ncbi:MAG TPA: hypothetical protein VKN18_20540 [Blastocatellia bacterium]|nr:hypothetical protein [Blastocatellia bacterium]
MKTEKKENLTNDKLNPRAEVLADLSVTDEQAVHAKGGPLSLNFEKISYRQIEYYDEH